MTDDPPRLPFDVPDIVTPDETGGTIDEQFCQFHATNPFVYRHLVAMTRDLARRGRSRVGIGMLFEVLRWQYAMTTNDPSSDFRLNNNYRSRYARLIMEQEPDLDGIYELRSLRSA